MTRALVVGGGLAGAAIATRLALAGREVVLVEREERATDKVCGEFLSHEAIDHLTALGLDLPALGAVPITRVRLCEGRRDVMVELPFAALSLSRRVLDEALLERAESAGVRLERGVRIKAIEGRAALHAGGAIEGNDVFLATGKHDLRSHKRSAGLQNDLVAFKLHLRLANDQLRALTGSVELTLFDGGYAGLQAIEGGVANLCLLVRRARLTNWDGLYQRLLAEPHLAARLAGAEPCTAKPLAISAIPYGLVEHRTDGVWRLGDQAAVIPSFAGDGMSIALHSAALAASAYLAGDRAAGYQGALARSVRVQVLLATALSHGLVRRRSQRMLTTIARNWPQVVTTIAARTRVA